MIILPEPCKTNGIPIILCDALSLALLKRCKYQ